MCALCPLNSQISAVCPSPGRPALSCCGKSPGLRSSYSPPSRQVFSHAILFTRIAGINHASDILDFVLRTVAGAAPDWNRIPY